MSVTALSKVLWEELKFNPTHEVQSVSWESRTPSWKTNIPGELQVKNKGPESLGTGF